MKPEVVAQVQALALVVVAVVLFWAKLDGWG